MPDDEVVSVYKATSKAEEAREFPNSDGERDHEGRYDRREAKAHH